MRFGDRDYGLFSGGKAVVGRKSFVIAARGTKTQNENFPEAIFAKHILRGDLNIPEGQKFLDKTGVFPVDILEKPIHDETIDMPQGFALGLMYSIYLRDDAVQNFKHKKVLCAPIIPASVSVDVSSVWTIIPSQMMPIIGKVPTKIGEKNGKPVIVPIYVCLAV